MNTINNMPMPITIFGRFNMKWTMKWVVTFELYLFLPSLLFLRKRKKSKQHSSIKLVKLCHSFFGIYFLSANMACFVVVAVWRLFFSLKKNYLHIVLLTRQVSSSICVYNSVLFLPLLLLCFTTIFAASVFYVLFFVFFFFLFLIINECLIVCHQYFVREFGWVSFAQNAYLLDKQIESKWVCWTKKKSWLIAQHRFKCSYKMDKVKNTRRILIKIYIEDERRRKKPASYRKLLNTTIADVIVMW